MKNPSHLLSLNLGLLLTGVATAFSGFFIQLHYHMGNQGGTDHVVWGLNHSQWTVSHQISIVLFSVLMIDHVILHWNWYKVIIRKNRIAKNQQVLILSIVFLGAALTGWIPWFLKMTNSEAATRHILIEIHDKLGLILIVFLALHIGKRMKWFKSAIIKLKNNTKS